MQEARAQAAETRAAHPLRTRRSRPMRVTSRASRTTSRTKVEGHFSDWAPGRVAATPDRPVFSPTPRDVP
eukprot:220010-Prymnesium_polylepis.2